MYVNISYQISRGKSASISGQAELDDILSALGKMNGGIKVCCSKRGIHITRAKNFRAYSKDVKVFKSVNISGAIYAFLARADEDVFKALKDIKGLHYREMVWK